VVCSIGLGNLDLRQRARALGLVEVKDDAVDRIREQRKNAVMAGG
jgi:hypothetical protein